MENKFLKVLLLVCFLTLTSCSAQKSNYYSSSISFEKIGSHSYGGFQEEIYYVITDIQLLKKIYTQINLARKPGLQLPTIDFDKECVVALFMGQKKSGGFAVEMDSIINKKNNSFEIIIKEISPIDMASMAITKPFIIYKLNIPNPKIKFIKSIRVSK